MSSQQPAPGAPFRSVQLDSSLASSSAPPTSFWDKVTTWASENKAVVYTIAGVAVVVTGAGVVYYLSDTKKDDRTSDPKLSKKERRRAKKEASDKGKAAVKEPILERGRSHECN